MTTDQITLTTTDARSISRHLGDIARLHGEPADPAVRVAIGNLHQAIVETIPYDDEPTTGAVVEPGDTLTGQASPEN